jgi:putative thioredoxin
VRALSFSPMATDVSESDFQHAVIDRSREVPVVVDFWASWCGPCRALSPTLERVAGSLGDKVDLVKVDVDANQGLSRDYGVQGIPAVKAFRDGEVVDEFVGAQPAAAVERFFNKLVPSEADNLVAAGDEDSLRRALALEPGRADAATALGRMRLERGEVQEALDVLEPVKGDFAAEGLAAQAQLRLANGARDGVLAQALDALASGNHETALQQLVSALESADGDEEEATRDLIRRVMVGLFNELGTDHPLSREYRQKLAAALY